MKPYAVGQQQLHIIMHENRAATRMPFHLRQATHECVSVTWQMVVTPCNLP